MYALPSQGTGLHFAGITALLGQLDMGSLRQINKIPPVKNPDRPLSISN
jgi:hypothetical protein